MEASNPKELELRKAIASLEESLYQLLSAADGQKLKAITARNKTTAANIVVNLLRLFVRTDDLMRPNPHDGAPQGEKGTSNGG